eukprot:gene7933-16247_t
MSTSFKRQEIQVIDDKILSEGVSGSQPNGRGDISLVEVAPTTEVLTMSFMNIGRIENLVGFDNLTKLCLDNNSIEQIINLEHLVNLRWLDLSFNKISKIEGLGNLTKLEDLSVYSNRVSIIEGLEQCQNLQCLSLGNNHIESLEQVIRLRQLRSLRMLTLKGNPIYEEPEYKMTILAYVDGLKYLDYALVDQNELHIAKEQYHDELLDVEEKESVVAEKVSRDKMMSEYLQQLSQAGIEFAHILFDDMFVEDPDLEKLKHLPGTKELVESFRNQFKNLSDDFVKNAMETYAKKKKEISDFERAVKQIRTKDDSESTHLIETFNKSKKTALATLMLQQNQAAQSYEQENGQLLEKQRVVKKLQEELDKIGDELMSIELRQVEKFEALIDEFDNRLNEIKNYCLEMQQLFFRAVEELEDKFSSNIRGVATDLIDRLTKEELAEDYLDDDAMALVVDKDVCMGTLSGSHDMHIGKILKREDEARALETKRYQDCVSGYNNTERARNRDRILQVHDLCRSTKATLSALLSMEEDEGGFDEDMAIL